VAVVVLKILRQVLVELQLQVKVMLVVVVELQIIVVVEVVVEEEESVKMDSELLLMRVAEMVELDYYLP
jgi:hypothetical protein